MHAIRWWQAAAVNPKRWRENGISDGLRAIRVSDLHPGQSEEEKGRRKRGPFLPGTNCVPYTSKVGYQGTKGEENLVM